MGAGPKRYNHRGAHGKRGTDTSGATVQQKPLREGKDPSTVPDWKKEGRTKRDLES